MRILEIVRDYHPKPTPHKLQTITIVVTVEVSPCFPPPPTDRRFFYPASVLVLGWALQVSWFQYGTPSVFVFVWVHFYTGFNVGEQTWIVE